MTVRKISEWKNWNSKTLIFLDDPGLNIVNFPVLKTIFYDKQSEKLIKTRKKNAGYTNLRCKT